MFINFLRNTQRSRFEYEIYLCLPFVITAQMKMYKLSKFSSFNI